MFYEQLKGDPHILDGRLTVYCRIRDTDDLTKDKNNPIVSLIGGGFLAACGDYRYSRNLADFLKKEAEHGGNLSIHGFLSQMGGPQAMQSSDWEKLIQNLGSLKGIGEYIPTPAAFEKFSSEEEIMDEAGDIFFLGDFSDLTNATFCINSFPILYQAIYREQLHQKLSREIDKLLKEIGNHYSAADNYSAYQGNLSKRILGFYVPSLFYTLHDRAENKRAEQEFRRFMSGYKFPQDVQSILDLIQNVNIPVAKKNYLIELHINKIAAVTDENFKLADTISRKIQELQ